MKLLTKVAVIAAFACAITACSKDDDGFVVGPGGSTINYATDFYTLDSETYPSLETLSEGVTAGADELGEVEMNPYYINGGVLMVSLETATPMDALYFSVDGGKDSYKISTDDLSEVLVDDKYSYFVELMVKQGASRDLDLTITGEASGVLTQSVTAHSQLVKVNSEGIQISVTFDNDKDIDLHLFLPNTYQLGDEIGTDGDLNPIYENEIYFGNMGQYSEEDSSLMLYGMDLTSNNDANNQPDYIRNENIFIPRDYVFGGDYIVKLNMYSNMNPYIATNYIVRVVEDDENIALYRGTFDVGADSNEANTDEYVSFPAFTLEATILPVDPDAPVDSATPVDTVE